MILNGNDTIGMGADDGIHCYPIKKSGYLKPWWDFERHVFAWIIAGVCAVASIILSFHLIIKHYQYYHRPEFQRHIVRIILMVPIYSVCSFLSMIYYDSAVYFDVTKNCYEAFVIHSFFALILMYLGQNEEEQLASLADKDIRRYPFPFGCFKFDPKKSSFLVRCKRLTLQYVIIHPVTTVIAVILEATNLLCPDIGSADHPIFWIQNTEMTSVSVAMYGLVLIYLVVHDDMEEHGLISKLIAVKFVIFFSFWQSICISIGGSMGLIKETEAYTVSNVATSLQSFLICIEMVVASILHLKSFPYSPFVPKDGTKTPLMHGLLDSLNFRDYMDEMKIVMKKDAALDDEQFARLKNGRLDYDEDVIVMPVTKGGGSAREDPDITENIGFDMSKSLSSKQKKKKVGKSSKYNEIAMDVLDAHNWEEDARMEGEEEDFPDLFDPNVLIPGKLKDMGNAVVGGRGNLKGKDAGAYVNIAKDGDMMMIDNPKQKAKMIGSDDDLNDDGASSAKYNYSYVPTVTFDDKDEP